MGGSSALCARTRAVPCFGAEAGRRLDENLRYLGERNADFLDRRNTFQDPASKFDLLPWNGT